MKDIPKRIAIVLFMLPVLAAAQGRASDYEPTVRQFLQKMGREYSVNSLEFSRNRKRVDAKADDYFIGVDAEHNVVTSWADSRAGRDLRKRDGIDVKVESSSKAMQLAEVWLRRANFELHPFDQTTERKSGGELHSYVVRFREAPFGYSGGVTNVTTVTVNVFSGQIAEVMRTVKYSYTEPDIRLSEADAINAVTARVQDIYDLTLHGATIERLIFSTPGGGELWDSQAAPELDDGVASLVYAVSGTISQAEETASIMAFVNVSTGAVMGGGLARGGSEVSTTVADQPLVEQEVATVPAEKDDSKSNKSIVIIASAVAIFTAILLKFYRK